MECIEKVSAIIVTHNRFELFVKALEGVRKQTYPNIECIVVDDASADQTESFCRKQKDLLYIRIEPQNSCGANYARNIGLRAASGKYVAYCDDDDIWMPDKTTREVELLEAFPSIGMAYCGRICTYYSGGCLLRKEEEWPIRLNSGNMARRILYIIPCVTSTIIFRRSLLLQVGGFDENLKYWQEYELLIRLCQLAELGFVKELLIKYRIDASDCNRKSNKYNQWLSVPPQIRVKHKALYSQLNLLEWLMYWRLYYNDAYVRSLAMEKKSVIVSLMFKKKLSGLLSFPYRVFQRLFR